MLIALIEEERPVLVVVHGPAVGLTYTACGPGTATRRSGKGAAELIRARAPEDGLVVIHSRSHENSRRLAEFLQDYPVRARKSCGSALKFGVIAAGEADLYPRFGTTMERDTAAGQAVLEAAGRRVENLAAAPLVYGKSRGDDSTDCGRASRRSCPTDGRGDRPHVPQRLRTTVTMRLRSGELFPRPSRATVGLLGPDEPDEPTLRSRRREPAR